MAVRHAIMMGAMALDRALGQGLGIKGEHDTRWIDPPAAVKSRGPAPDFRMIMGRQRAIVRSVLILRGFSDATFRRSKLRSVTMAGFNFFRAAAVAFRDA